MIARVYVPGQYMNAIRLDQRVFVQAEFLDSLRFEGWVKRISPVVDPKSGTFKVTVGVTDASRQLRPGIFIEVQIITDTHLQATLLPKGAVVYDGGARYVFAVRDSLATRVKLHAGFENSQFVEALSGVEPDEAIIVVGQDGLKDGAKVRVVSGPPAEDGSIAAIADSAGVGADGDL